ESTGLRLNQPCPPYVTPSSISSFGRRLSNAHIAESKSLKNSGQNTFCQSSARMAGGCQQRRYFDPGRSDFLLPHRYMMVVMDRQSQRGNAKEKRECSTILNTA
ncbi:hypothetical protein L6654_20705, partial [Bradyrhizobium sp. WYCCWR 13023]